MSTRMEYDISVKRVHKRYNIFSREIKNIWQEYNFLQKAIGNTNGESFEQNSLLSPDKLTIAKRRVGGNKDRFLFQGNTRSHFIDSFGLFEEFISDIVRMNFINYPEKLGKEPLNAIKMYELIGKYDSTQEVLDKIIEEKIRSIFYGNPLDIFLKDKCKIECKDYFSNYQQEIKINYAEIVARRNSIIHNRSRVDSKFLKEVPETSLKEGNKIIISEDYLRGTLALLIGLGAGIARCLVEEIYKTEVQGKLKNGVSSFENASQNDWYTELLKG